MCTPPRSRERVGQGFPLTLILPPVGARRSWIIFLGKFNLHSLILNLKLLPEPPFILTGIGKWVSLVSLKTF